MSTATPEGLLLGDYELTPSERSALRRRHNAALKVVRHLSMDERLELLRAVVWPSDDLRETVAAIDAGEQANF